MYSFEISGADGANGTDGAQGGSGRDGTAAQQGIPFADEDKHLICVNAVPAVAGGPGGNGGAATAGSDGTMMLGVILDLGEVFGDVVIRYSGGKGGKGQGNRIKFQ